jgi:hypothetical protein
MRRITSCPIKMVNIRLNCSHVCLDLSNRCFESCKGCFRNPVAVQMSCEHWRDSRVLLKSNLQKFSHLLVGLKDIPTCSSNPLRH